MYSPSSVNSYSFHPQVELLAGTGWNKQVQSCPIRYRSEWLGSKSRLCLCGYNTQHGREQPRRANGSRGPSSPPSLHPWAPKCCSAPLRRESSAAVLTANTPWARTCCSAPLWKHRQKPEAFHSVHTAQGCSSGVRLLFPPSKVRCQDRNTGRPACMFSLSQTKSKPKCPTVLAAQTDRLTTTVHRIARQGWGESSPALPMLLWMSFCPGGNKALSWQLRNKIKTKSVY